jgi:hypothetical protein
MVISVLEMQECHVFLDSCPSNGVSTNWIIQSIVAVPSLRHQTSPAIVGSEFTLPALFAADLQIALQVSIAKVFSFVVGQQIDGLMGMP